MLYDITCADNCGSNDLLAIPLFAFEKKKRKNVATTEERIDVVRTIPSTVLSSRQCVQKFNVGVTAEIGPRGRRLACKDQGRKFARSSARPPQKLRKSVRLDSLELKIRCSEFSSKRFSSCLSLLSSVHLRKFLLLYLEISKRPNRRDLIQVCDMISGMSVAIRRLRGKEKREKEKCGLHYPRDSRSFFQKVARGRVGRIGDRAVFSNPILQLLTTVSSNVTSSSRSFSTVIFYPRNNDVTVRTLDNEKPLRQNRSTGASANERLSIRS